MFTPDPSDLVIWIVLIFGKPQLAFLANDIEDLENC